MRRLLPYLLAASALVGAVPAPVTDPTFQPLDKDERGIWMQMEEEERKLQTSEFVMRDPGLNAYVRDVFCRTVGQAQCKPVRIYIVQTPYFNASMAPNGLMLVWSGLFLRMRNEAQLAAVLGHEYTHYRARHSLRLFREVKKKSDAYSLLIVPAAIFGGYLGATALQTGMIGSIYGFSRDMEREADAGSITMLASAGYDPHAASKVWEQLRAEEDATALARGKHSRKDKNGGIFATHPPTAERMAELRMQADKSTGVANTKVNREAYLKALSPFWAQFVDDQIKLNDLGATDFLLTSLAEEGWTGPLLYARGELYRARGKPDDLKAAAGYYKQALAAGGAPVESQRGLGLSLLRSGDKEGGQAALRAYLTARPDASDRAIIASLAGLSS
jgi:beta-barrel assembly-enhancing protease